MATKTVPADRAEVAFHATHRLESLLRILHREKERDDSEFDIVLDETLRRANELVSVIASVVGGDDARTTEDMSRVVYGPQAIEAGHA